MVGINGGVCLGLACRYYLKLGLVVNSRSYSGYLGRVKNQEGTSVPPSAEQNRETPRAIPEVR